MPKKREIHLTAEARCELEQAVRSHAKAYVRERASAVLKVADGMSAVQVARHGLLRRRSPDSVNLCCQRQLHLRINDNYIYLLCRWRWSVGKSSWL